MYTHPIIFVHYPTGAGGRFLSALLQYSISFSPVLIDDTGSGHSNTSSRFSTNFYKIISTNVGMDIIHSTSSLSTSNQIRYLRSNFKISNSNMQVIGLHCTDINIFLAAFPNSKCIQINITNNDILKCVGNFLFKVMLSNPLYLKTLCNQYNVDYDQAVIKIKNLNESTNLKFFEWCITDYILSTAKNVSNQHEFNDRILEIMYSEYMNDDIDNLLTSFLSFISVPYSTETFDTMYNYLLTYRIKQPNFSIPEI